jgi:hypothetical protein
LSKFTDPSGSTTACTSGSSAQCDYSVSQALSRKSNRLQAGNEW